MNGHSIQKAIEGSTLCALIVSDESGAVRYANENLIHLLQTQQQSLTELNLTDLLQPDQPAALRGRGLLTGEDGVHLRVDYSRVPLIEESVEVVWITPGPIQHDRLDQLLKTSDFEDFSSQLDAITEALAEAFRLDYVVIGSKEEDSNFVRRLSSWSPEGRLPAATFDIDEQPECSLYNDGTISVPTRLREHYPASKILEEFQANGYYGVPVTDGRDQSIGHLAAFSCTHLFPNPALEHYFALFAARLGSLYERRRMAIQLDARTTLLAELSTHLPGLLFQFSRTNGVLRLRYAGETLPELTGVEVADAERSFDELVRAAHPEDRGDFLHAIQTSAERLTELDWTGRFELKNRAVYLRWMAKPVLGARGAVHWSGYMTDATELEAMRARQQEVEALAGIGHFDVNVDTQELWWSPGQYAIFHVDPEEGPPVRQEFLDAMPEETRRINRHVFDEAVRTGEPFDLEWTYPVEAGERHIHTRGKPIKDRYGTVRWITGTNFDITRQKEAEEAAAVSDERLRQAQKMEAIGQLAGGVAHDFNNLLTAILGFTELARGRAADNAGIQEDLAEVLQAAKRAQELTSRLVTIGRKQVVKRIQLDLNQLLEELQPLLRRTIDEDIAIVFDLERIEGSILGETSSLEQVVLNLAVNARDAMPAGGRLVIKTRTIPRSELEHLSGVSEAPLWVAISVEDNGCGMSQREIDHIFEPFYTTKPKDKGTGLGLATVYGVVDRMGGILDVKSKIGEGTTMLVYLPLHDAAPVSELALPTQKIRGGSETVLIVEDDRRVRKFSSSSLEMLGYRVLETESPAMALSLLEQGEQRVDLLFTDVVMPGMSGTELARRAGELLPELKVLFTTGFTQDKTIIHGLDPGQEGVLLKPFSLEELGTRVRSTLDVAMPSLGRHLPNAEAR